MELYKYTEDSCKEKCFEDSLPELKGMQYVEDKMAQFQLDLDMCQTKNKICENKLISGGLTIL